MHFRRNFALLSALLTAFLAMLLVHESQAFFVFVGNSTACNTCDDHLTYSARNVLCCIGCSKCCG